MSSNHPPEVTDDGSKSIICNRYLQNIKNNSSKQTNEIRMFDNKQAKVAYKEQARQADDMKKKEIYN